MDFIFKLFIKDYDNVSDVTVRNRYGKLAGIVGIISNLILAGAKYLVGTLSGSIAIIADGVNNLSDASSSVITLLGFKLASLPEDKEHPYGHARIEYIAGMIVSMIIMLVGFELGKEAVQKIFDPEPVAFGWNLVIVLVLSIAVKIGQMAFYISAGKKINSLTLIATGTDSRNDVIATFAVLAGVLTEEFLNLKIDGYMGLLVAAFILWSGFSLTKETISPLLGEAPSKDLLKGVEEIIGSYEGIIGYHDLVVHNYGAGKTFVSVHIEVDGKTDIMKSHDMIDDIEWRLHKELNVFATGHMDPVDRTNPDRESISEILKSKISEMEGVLDFHDLRIVPGDSHTNVIFDVLLSPDCKTCQDEITELLCGGIRAYNSKYICKINYDVAYSAT